MNHRRACGQLDVLYEISRELLAPDRELEASLEAVLDKLASWLGVERAMIAIHDRRGSEIRAAAPDGQSRPRDPACRSPIIIGQVLERGQPALELSGSETLILDRGRPEKDLDWSRVASAWVPIAGRREVMGAISVERCGGGGPGLAEEGLRFLEVAAAIIGEAVRDWRDHREEAESLRRTDRRREERAGEFRPPGMVGNSPQLLQVFELIRQVAPFETTVLIRGECGTGKELVARAVHALSARRAGPFVAVDCGALPEHLLASDLFGHVRGAYPGAEGDRRGRFELAHGGTIFLDEVGDLIPAIQVKLLRVLQQGEIERLEEERAGRIDVRLVAATTNAGLEKAITAGRFREDLFYRLNAFPIDLAPLRERQADIPLLADHFLQVYARKHRKRVLRVSAPALELMAAYRWPGNVRELENSIGRAVLLAEDGVIHAHHLPPAIKAGGSGAAPSDSLAALMKAYEREILSAAMKNAGGNQTRAARALATTPRILGYRLRRHGLLPGPGSERQARAAARGEGE